MNTTGKAISTCTSATCSNRQEYLAAIKARPITAERVDLRDLSMPWHELPSYGSRRRLTNSNGK